jgi:adenylate cyclase
MWDHAFLISVARGEATTGKRKFASGEDEWRAYLGGTHPDTRLGHRTFHLLPWGPRCKMCSGPFRGPFSFLRRFGSKPWDKNPNLCSLCVNSLNEQDVSGAEMEVSFLFADVRRSSDLARRPPT